MAAPTRFSSGVSTVGKNDLLGNYPAPDPTKVYTYFNDFNTYVAGDWTVTEINDATQALLADEPFGALRITLAGADNDGSQSQLVSENFTITAGKKAWFKARFKVSDATQSDLLMGLAVLDTTLLGSTNGDGVTDGMFFAKEDGDTNIDFHVQKDATTGQLSTSAVATLADNTYIVLGYEFDGVRFVKVFVNGVLKTTVDMTATLTTYMPDTPLTVSFALLAGEAEATTMTIDYVFAAIER
jgi:hypothetical protein